MSKKRIKKRRVYIVELKNSAYGRAIYWHCEGIFKTKEAAEDYINNAWKDSKLYRVKVESFRIHKDGFIYIEETIAQHIIGSCTHCNDSSYWGARKKEVINYDFVLTDDNMYDDYEQYYTDNKDVYENNSWIRAIK